MTIIIIEVPIPVGSVSSRRNGDGLSSLNRSISNGFEIVDASSLVVGLNSKMIYTLSDANNNEPIGYHSDTRENRMAMAGDLIRSVVVDLQSLSSNIRRKAHEAGRELTGDEAILLGQYGKAITASKAFGKSLNGIPPVTNH